MDRVRIKICGLMRPQDIDMVNEVCPDIAGFILASGRRRTVTPEQMRELTGRLKPEIRSAAVFLDQDIRWIADLAEGGLMDIIQLHGHEGNEEIRYLRSRTDKTVIKAFRIDTAEDIRRAEDSEADLVLLDHGAGGTGQAWDWSLLTGMKRPFILAGGLDSGQGEDPAVCPRSPAVLTASAAGVKMKRSLCRGTIKEEKDGYTGRFQRKIRTVRRTVHTGDADERGHRTERCIRAF